MKIQVEFGKWHQGEGRLSERLNILDDPLYLEASTAREVFERLKKMTPQADTAFELWFSRIGFLRSSWSVIVNKGDKHMKSIKSESDLDAPLNEGDRIYITSGV